MLCRTYIKLIMKLKSFLTITSILSFVFGACMFFVPATALQSLGISSSLQTISVTRGMGGLIIGFASINFMLRNCNDNDVLKHLLLANIITHAFGLTADVWGFADGAVTLAKMAPVEITHLVIGVGSLVYLVRRKQ